MSKDIRSFFKIDNNSKKRKNEDNSISPMEKKKSMLINHLITGNDNDGKKSNKTTKKKRRIIESDDEEEEKVSTSKKQKDENVKVESKKKEIEVKDVKNLFGGPVKRTERSKAVNHTSPETSNNIQQSNQSSKKSQEIAKVDGGDLIVIEAETEESKVISPGKENLKNNDKPEKEKEIPKKKEETKQKSPTKASSPKRKEELKKIDKRKSPIKIKSPKKKDDDSKQKSKTPTKSRPSTSSSQSNHASKSTTVVPPVTIIPKTSPTDANKQKQQVQAQPKPVKTIDMNDFSFVDKYKPTSLKQVIGQQGPQSNANKLQNWLLSWHKNHGDPNKKQKKGNPFAKDSDGSGFKAALLSGPPGVGKTTTVQLVCQETFFDTVEFNASDTRSKRLLKEEVSQLLSNKSLKGYLTGDDSAVSKRHVLIMDEVDGMAGNEDRGGMAELIQLIKESQIPIICMCNDRSHPKIRSLVNYCYDLRFYKPSINQIRSAMMSVCFKEGIKLEPGAIDAIISGTGNDVRQTLNHLAMYSAQKDVKISAVGAKKTAQMSEKDIKIGPWDVIRKVFTAEEHKNMSFNDKCDLFFYDYNIAPLFVQENYLNVKPACKDSQILDRIAKTADSLSLGDTVEKKIRSNMAWSLLPTQAIFSSVLPGEYLKGSFKSAPSFPTWLGKNSKAQKRKRLAQEIHDHTRMSTSGSRLSVRLDYAQFLIQAIIRPLKEKGLEGVSDAMEVIKEYRLLREDIDSLLELTTWGSAKSPWDQIDSKVKAALTRTYNKEIQPYSYSVMAGVKKKKTSNDSDGINYEDGEGNDEASDEEEEEESLDKNSMIKVKKAAPAKASTSKAAAASKPKGKGKK